MRRRLHHWAAFRPAQARCRIGPSKSLRHRNRSAGPRPKPPAAGLVVRFRSSLHAPSEEFLTRSVRSTITIRSRALFRRRPGVRYDGDSCRFRFPLGAAKAIEDVRRIEFRRAARRSLREPPRGGVDCAHCPARGSAVGQPLDARSFARAQSRGDRFRQPADHRARRGGDFFDGRRLAATRGPDRAACRSQAIFGSVEQRGHDRARPQADRRAQGTGHHAHASDRRSPTPGGRFWP